MVSQLLLNLVLIVLLVALATKAPDIIVVGEDGQGTYVPRTVATAALQDFLRQQQGKAADVTLLAFTRRFVGLTAAINSTTIDEAWREALAMMTTSLSERLRKEAGTLKMLEASRLAQLRTTLDYKSLTLVERRGDKAHVRALIARHKTKLIGDPAPSDDAIQVDLVLHDVPRSSAHPDGLEVLDWRSGVPDADVPPSTPPTVSPAGPTK